MAVEQHDKSDERTRRLPDKEQTSQLIDWFAEGQTLAVEFAGIVMTVRYVCRKGRRARIAITEPAGAVFRALDLSEPIPRRPQLSSSPKVESGRQDRC